MKTPTLSPEIENINQILTRWLFRMRESGELKSFVENKGGGFWVFECQDAVDLLAKVEQRARDEATKEAYLRMASRIDSHGFIGWMTGKYKLESLTPPTTNERKAE